MVNLYVCKNVVFLSKSQKDYKEFITSFLVKYEEVSRLDYYSSTKTKKRFKYVKERRNLYSEDNNFITFSRGLLSVIPTSEYTAEYREDDNKLVVPNLTYDEIKTTLSCFDLRDDQVIAVMKSLVAKRGVIQLPTATGKSAIITSTIKRLIQYNPKIKVLVLAPTLSTVENINNTLLSNGVDTHIFGHPDKSISMHPVTTSLVQSLISTSKDDEEFLSEVDAVFYDECLPYKSKILLSDGSTKCIGDIYKDDTIDSVLSYNTDTHTYEIKRIVRKFRTPFNSKFWKVYYDDPVAGYTKGITLTYNHKLWTKRGYVQASELTKDDYIKIDYPFLREFSSTDSATYIKVKRVTPNVGSVAEYKYNLEVEDNHNYFANNVLVSNCHHLKCDTWNKLNLLLKNVEYSLGFSALSIDKSEIYETDIRNISYQSALIIGCSGKVIMHMDPSYYIKLGIIALPKVFRLSNTVELPKGIDESQWSLVSKLGLMSTPRTVKISEVCKVFSKYNRKTLVLVSERDYAFVLGKYLYDLGISSYGISFGSGTGYIPSGVDPNGDITYNNINTLDVIDKLSTGSISVLIGTSHIDEGIDIKSLDSVILACGGKKDRRIIQRVGRVLRKSKTGKYAYVIDFTDNNSRVLSRQSAKRRDMYKDTIGVTENDLYDDISIDEFESKFVELEGLNLLP